MFTLFVVVQVCDSSTMRIRPCELALALLAVEFQRISGQVISGFYRLQNLGNVTSRAGSRQDSTLFFLRTGAGLKKDIRHPLSPFFLKPSPPGIRSRSEPGLPCPGSKKRPDSLALVKLDQFLTSIGQVMSGFFGVLKALKFNSREIQVRFGHTRVFYS